MAKLLSYVFELLHTLVRSCFYICVVHYYIAEADLESILNNVQR